MSRLTLLKGKTGIRMPPCHHQLANSGSGPTNKTASYRMYGGAGTWGQHISPRTKRTQRAGCWSWTQEVGQIDAKMSVGWSWRTRLLLAKL
jgi:hypothetical protein